jgi:hypothetical protein
MLVPVHPGSAAQMMASPLGRRDQFRASYISFLARMHLRESTRQCSRLEALMQKHHSSLIPSNTFCTRPKLAKLAWINSAGERHKGITTCSWFYLWQLSHC